jgi:hypothetical protein
MSISLLWLEPVAVGAGLAAGGGGRLLVMAAAFPPISVIGAAAVRATISLRDGELMP